MTCLNQIMPQYNFSHMATLFYCPVFISIIIIIFKFISTCEGLAGFMSLLVNLQWLFVMTF